MNILNKVQEFYEKKYKLVLIIPIIFILFTAGVLGYWKITNGEFVSKDASLKGGLMITVKTGEQIDINSVERSLTKTLDSPATVKALRSVATGGTIGYTFETPLGLDKDEVLSEISAITDIELVQGEYTVEEVSASLGSSFWQSTVKAIAVAFLVMSIVILLYFRKLIPSAVIVLSAAVDMGGTLAIMNLLGVPLSMAGVAALLMLIGYSVDTDVLLTAKIINERGEAIIDGMRSAIKTGLTMQFTTIAALTVLYIISPAQVLRQITLILTIGLLIDLSSTWLMNAGLLRWYLERKQNG